MGVLEGDEQHTYVLLADLGCLASWDFDLNRWTFDSATVVFTSSDCTTGAYVSSGPYPQRCYTTGSRIFRSHAYSKVPLPSGLYAGSPGACAATTVAETKGWPVEDVTARVPIVALPLALRVPGLDY